MRKTFPDSQRTDGFKSHNSNTHKNIRDMGDPEKIRKLWKLCGV